MKIVAQFFSLIFIVNTIFALGKDGRRRKKKLGTSCSSDKDCATGHCDGKWFWAKKCVECEKDAHCKGHGISPMGTAPAAFCAKNKCSKWRRGKPIGSKGYALNIDSLVWIPRKVVKKPTGHEIIRFRLDDEPNAGITITRTHAYVPINSHLQGDYAIKNDVTEVEEAGIVNLFFANNPFSVIFDDPLFNAGLKYHALEVEGKTNTLSADRVRKEVKRRSKFTNNLAMKLRHQRDNLVAAATVLTNAGPKLVEVSQDIDHLNQIRAFVKLENGKKGVARLLASSSYRSLVARAKNARKLSKTVKSKKSMNHCKHFEKKSGVRLTKTHVIIPLEKNLLFGAGQTEFSPSRWFAIGAGYTVFKYNKEDKALEMFQVYTQQMHKGMDSKVDQKGVTPPTLWVGPADGHKMRVSAVDGRTDEFYDDSKTSPAVIAALAAIDAILPDYNRMYEDPTKRCSNEYREKFKESFRIAKKNINKYNVVKQMWIGANIAEASTDSVDCGTIYLRSDSQHTNAFDILEFAVWLHMILETDSENHVDVELCLNSHWWDDGVKLEGMDDNVKSEDVSMNEEATSLRRRENSQ